MDTTSTAALPLTPLTDFVPSIIPETTNETERDPSVVEQLIRQPQSFAINVQNSPSPALIRTLLIVVALGAGVFGAVIGSYRGGRQILYCATKLPLVLIATLVICTPAFVGIARALGITMTTRSVIALTLGACARFALILAGLAPVVWLLNGWLGYHGVVLTIVAMCVIAGIAAATLLSRGLPRASAAGLAFVAVYAIVGGQTAWLLRPFVVRPRTETVPFIRPIEGDLVRSVRSSARSAAGIYDAAQQTRSSAVSPRCNQSPCE